MEISLISIERCLLDAWLMLCSGIILTNILGKNTIHERGIPFSTNHWTWVYIVNDLWPWVPHHPDVLLFEFPLYPSVAINIGCSMLTPFYCIENVAILSLSFKPSPA